MRKTAVFSLALLLCSPVAQARSIEPAAPLPYEQLRSQRMAALSPSLREWVRVQGRSNAQSPRDADAVGAAVRERLAGQEFADGDVDMLVQLVMMETTKDAEEDLREVMAQMKAENEHKKAMREQMQQSREAQGEMKGAMRAAYGQRTQLAPVAASQATVSAPPPAAAATIRTQGAAPQEETDTMGDLSEDMQLRLQMAQDRRDQAMQTLSNLMKKNSETSSGIIGNLK